jgi:hypothetical protein
VHPCLLPGVPFRAAQYPDPLGRQQRQHLGIENLILQRHPFAHLAADSLKHLPDRYAIGVRSAARFDSRFQAGDTDLEEFIQIAVDDAQIAQSFERWHARIGRQCEHAAVEFNLAEFTIEIKANS